MNVEPQTKAHRILLVEDQPTLVVWTRHVLEQIADLEVFVCSDGKRALEAAHTCKPTVIVQDLLMPKVHGFDLIAAYKAEASLADIPIIVLSGVDDVHEKAHAFELGAADYLVKLPDAIELQARVRAHSLNFLMRRELREAKEELSATFERAAIGKALIAPDGSVLRVNDALCKMLGYSREELLESGLARFTHAEDRESDRVPLQRLLRGEMESVTVLKRYVHRNGAIVWGELSSTLATFYDGSPRFFISQIVDVTSRHDAQHAANRQAAITRAVIDSMHDAVMVVDASGELLLINTTARELFGPMLESGIPSEWPEGQGLFYIDRVTRCGPEEYPLMRALRGETVEEVILWMMMPGWTEGQWHSVTGNPVRDSTGALIGAVNVGRDVTARIKAESRLREASLQDELTRVCNRRGFSMLAEHQLKHADRADVPVFALFVDIDNMKAINDERGHEAGDAAIVATALLLQSVCRSSDIIARLGGDEFVVLAEGDAASADTLRSRVLDAAKSVRVNDTQFSFSLSVGIALRAPRVQGTLNQLLAEADHAMYAVKKQRKASK